MRTHSGPILIALFAIFSALRDVYFSGTFQDVSFFLVATMAFSVCTAAFLLWSAIADPGQLVALLRDGWSLLWMNATTALAWICYFFALQSMEPSVVNTLWAGAGPLTIVALGALGIHIARPARLSRLERVLQAGVLLSLVLLVIIALADLTGVPGRGWPSRCLGVLLTLASGVSIVIGVLFSKRFHERGIGARAVVATRFMLTAVVAGAILLTGAVVPPAPVEAARLTQVAAASSVLVVLPIYLFQLGMVRTTPITAEIILASSPILILALQAVDGRVRFSAYSLVAVLLYSTFTVAGVIARTAALRDQARAPDAADAEEQP